MATVSEHTSQDRASAVKRRHSEGTDEALQTSVLQTAALRRAIEHQTAGTAISAAGDTRALQRAIGNRAVSRLLAPSLVVQRHHQPTTNTEVGESEETLSPDPTKTSGTGTTGTPPSAPTGAARVKAIHDVLKASATGMWALGVIEKWKCPVDYEFGGTGSYHQGGNIYLNKNLGIGGAALVMMHEAQHANTFKSGTQADRTKLGRAEYVRLSIADEAEAVVRQIEGMAITKGLGVDMAGAGVDDALKERYLKAFYAKRDELNKANPGMSTDAVNKACRTHVRDTEVTNWFHDGTFVTSTNNNSYAVFYGNQWDEVNTPPTK